MTGSARPRFHETTPEGKAMYQSRLHATNGIVSIAVDALNGEILEFTREST